jgi:hypothetical protein
MSARLGLARGLACSDPPGLTVVLVGDPSAAPRGTGRDAAAAGSICETATPTLMFVGERSGIDAERARRGVAMGIEGCAPLTAAAGDQRRSGFQNQRPDD